MSMVLGKAAKFFEISHLRLRSTMIPPLCPGITNRFAAFEPKVNRVTADVEELTDMAFSVSVINCVKHFLP